MEGEVLVGSLKESATVLRQTKEAGQMREDIEGVFHSFEDQNPSELGDLSLPAFTPILKTLIRELWALDSFTTFFIGLPLAAVPEECFHHFQGLTDTLAEERRQESEGTIADLAEIAFYPNYPLGAPSAIKAMTNNLTPFAAVRTELYLRKMVIFSPLSIILDREAETVYDHPCLDRALEGIFCGISAYNPECFSRAFLFRGDVSD